MKIIQKRRYQRWTGLENLGWEGGGEGVQVPLLCWLLRRRGWVFGGAEVFG